MTFPMRLENLDRLSENPEIINVLHELEQRIASVTFDPNDEQSVEAAIRAVDDEIDQRLLPFQADNAVQEVAGALRAAAAEHIRGRAERERQ